MPSGQLANPFSAMSLDSQASQDVLRSRPGNRVSPPDYDGNEGMATCSQAEALGTQDYITPVDQFGTEADAAPGARLARSPAQLSPNRMKRARRAGTGTPPRQPGPGAGQRLVRVRSPPCYRCIFRDADAEEGMSAWSSKRDAASFPTSRMRLDFKELGLLGQGNYSKVFRVRHRLDGREYALKRSARETRPDSPDFAQYLQEVQVLAHTPPHPGLVRYHGAWVEPVSPAGLHTYLLLERCDVSLGTHLALSGERPAPAELARLVRALAGALAHLHAHGVAHLDLKPDNVYLLEGGEGHGAGGPAPPPPEYKLGDFGQAARLDGAGPAAVTEGDGRYMAPELMNADHRDLPAADMFALGATALQLASGEDLPRGGAAYAALRAGKLPLLPALPVGLARLIKALMSPNPADRPTAAKVLAMPCLQGEEREGTPTPPPAAAAGGRQQAPGSGSSAGGRGGAPQYSGLVLQRSAH
ncbi:WEE1 [Auxenochlorella protothecoides x Auxenochlorella symbiontica]